MPATSTTLRVLIDEPPDPARSAPWALSDAMGHLIQAGRGTPGEWPAADRREAVIAAAHGRIATLALPPLPPGRAEAAVRYALEDQLAEAADDSHAALAPQRADGRVRVAIVASAWMDGFVSASRRCDIEWGRAMLEADLADTATGTWRWCAPSIASPGFVRTDHGATIGVGPAHADALPMELTLALSRGDANTPRAVRVDADGTTPAFLAHARAATGVEFIAGRPWRWAEATPAAYAGAIDLLSGRYGPQTASRSFGAAQALRPALWIAGIALAFHVLATVGQWGWLRWQSLATEREMTALARAAIPEFAEGKSADASAAAALAHRERDLKHRAGLPARDDFVPLLGRAAPVLSGLPRGSIRSLSYADGHLLLDLTKLDANGATRAQSELKRSGLVAIVAPTQSGARLRIGWE
jgi:type II secretion system protein L